MKYYNTIFRLNKTVLLVPIAIVLICSSFSTYEAPSKQTADYYHAQTDRLLTSINKFRNATETRHTRSELLPYFYACRNGYKKVEFFVDVFLPNQAKALNGPDLLKIDEENPSDSLIPHGFQVVEAILFENEIDQKKLVEEIETLRKNIEELRNDPDRIYYFRNDRIWRALQLGVYRIISMGITGFDVPISYHALPECMEVLKSIRTVCGYYSGSLPVNMNKKGNALFHSADSFLATNNDFNKFDRLMFIRSYINPLSEWISQCNKQLGYINIGERLPINPFARHLFARDIINLDFFSPNSSYRITPERVALGKQLFYDPILSGNGKRSCASCHQPDKGFADGLQKQLDLSGKKKLLRNTPTLWNTVFQTAQFYDSRTKTLENQLSAVVHNSDEMDGSLKDMLPKLKADSLYSTMFSIAYPQENEHITEYNIANAIASYVRTLVSFNSPFDKYIRRESETLSASAQNGFNLFMGKAKCGTCHYPPLFNGLIPPLFEDTESETLAVPATDDSISNLDEDLGKYNFTQHPFHKYAFKTSTVRNAALTAPYMHNGVFKTLEAVIEFYNDGGGAGRGIDLPTQTLPTDTLGLTLIEKKDILAFIESLTDTTASQIRY